MSKIKVFIVEDSILMRKIISDIIVSDTSLEVVGVAQSAKEAFEKIPLLKPDIITLDINLPDLDGLKVLQKLLDTSPMRVIMLSALTQKNAEITMKALELGALDFIPKPSGEISLNLVDFKKEIIEKIKTVYNIDLKKSFSKNQITVDSKTAIEKIVIIGASTGGPKAILELMNGLPANLNASFLIIQHMPKGFVRSFAERISWHSCIKTKEAEDGDLILKGTAYVAPAGYHMIVEKLANDAGYRVRLDETPLVNYVRPSVDVTMISTADAFNGKIVGVILTGMGKDGLEGCRAVKKKGGYTITQDEASCVVYGMPKAVVNEGLSDIALPLSEISQKIIERIS